MANKGNAKAFKGITLAEKKPKQKQENTAKNEKVAAEVKKPLTADEKAAAERNSKIKRTKTALKAAGMKSAFVLDNETVLVTSFGQGNKAVLDKKIIGGEIKRAKDGEAGALDVSHLDKPSENNCHQPGMSYSVQGRRQNAVSSYADNPLAGKAEKTDLIGAKSALEDRFFGKTFTDNIHVQLAYSILDIEKILAPQVTNIAMKLNALYRMEGATDVIGYLGARFVWDKENAVNGFKTYSDSDTVPKRQNAESYMKDALLPYFYNVFYKGDRKRSFSEIFAVLTVIGELRQFCFEESRGDNRNADTDLVARNSLYDLDNVLPQKTKDVLKELYDAAFSTLNKGFLENNALINLPTLFTVLNADTEEKKQAIIRDYYLYVAKKDWKNLGFSVRELREAMLSQQFPQLTALKIRDDKEFGTVRGKLYTLMDFLMARYYGNDNAGKERAEAMRDELRALLYKNEEERIEARRVIYDKEAQKYWSGHSEEISKLVGALKNVATQKKGKSESEKKAEKEAFAEQYGSALKGIQLEPKDDPFCHVIYLLTMFQNGKEINDMMTSLVHCFDNISGFLDVMKECGLDCAFDNRYTFFEKSHFYAEQMRLILSFARMQKLPKKTKELLFADAVETLGYSMDKEECKAYAHTLLDKEERKKLSEKDAGIRHFIANNVLDSARFRYMIEYVKPSTARAIAQNENLTAFVLNDVPETQINRYYKLVTGIDNFADKSDKIKVLAAELKKVDFDQFKEVDQKADARKEPEQANEAEKYKAKQLAILSLYLTVIYLVVKNLVNVNSRYVMAFHALERDRLLLTGENNKSADYTDLVMDAIAKMHQKEKNIKARWETLPDAVCKQNVQPKCGRVADYLNVNVNNASSKFRARFRNDTTHLDMLRDMDAELKNVNRITSYFALYHYLEQQRLFKILPVAGKPEEKYRDDLQKHGTYCSDYVKALCAPFGYNLPRFKNLTIEDLFDRNRPQDEKKK